MIIFNTLVCILIINSILFFIFLIADKSSPNVISKKYSNVNLSSLYPDLHNDEINHLLKETWSRHFIYEPFTQFKEQPYRGNYVNIDNNGFRYTKNQGSWPPQSQNINIFLFGGSTTFGYGVSDNQTIASYLQQYLNEKLGKNVRVYNFGRGFYYLSQERVLYEQLLTSGFVPDMAIFIDGLNDFSYHEDEPLFTGYLRQLFNAGALSMSKQLISKTSLGRAAGIVGDEILSLSQKKAVNQLNDPKMAVLLDKIINRYLMDKKLIEAASKVLEVKSIFVWQPIPTYNFDQNNYPFATEGDGELSYSKYGYERMVKVIRENPMGNNFIWCADMQKGLKEPLYVDQFHYSASFSKLIAEVIANQLMARFNIKKRIVGNN